MRIVGTCKRGFAGLRGEGFGPPMSAAHLETFGFQKFSHLLEHCGFSRTIAT